MENVTEDSFIRRETKKATDIAANIDVFLISVLFIFVYSKHPNPFPNDEDFIAVSTFIQNADAMKIFATIWIKYSIFNLILLLSPLHATLGMLVTQIKKYTLSGQGKIRIEQVLGYLLLSPSFCSLNFLVLYHAYFGFQANLYYTANGAVLFVGLYCLLHTFYHVKYGGWENAQESILGLCTRFRSEKLEEIRGNWARKTMFPRINLTKFKAIGSAIFKPILIGLVALSFYLSALVILDLFKTPYMEEQLYKPYAIDWSRDNGYFALKGLNSPADSRDFIEFGRSVSYKNFLVVNELKGLIKNFPRFEIPAADYFIKVDKDVKPLEYQPVNTAHHNSFFECYSQIKKKKSDKLCATNKDITETIAKNKILWERFNKLPDFKEYQRPDDGIYGIFKVQSFINLSRLKVADILRLQKSGNSKGAFKEWVRFEKFYRQLTEAKVNLVEKAIFMNIFGVHHQGLEELLYNDPDLAKNNYNLIMSTLNPHGISIFRGQTMLADDFSQVEIYWLPNLYPSPGIRNKMFDCIKEQEALANLSAPQFPFQNRSDTICNNLQGQPEGLTFKSVFLTTGNPITSTIQTLLYGGLIKGVELISNMHIKDAELRMALLGTRIYKDKVAAKDVATYIKNSPKELQNPITQKPFEWDEKNNNLFFLPPNNEAKPKTFSINFGEK